MNKGLRFSIDGPVCQDPNTCYPVGESDVTANIALADDASHLLPSSFLMLGDLTDLRQGIYDVPSRSLSSSSATSERKNTPSYILMPPGTKETFSLPDWVSRNTDLFDPESGAVSPGLYRFAAKYDSENYPYCDTPSASPVTSPGNVTTRGCIAPYNYTTSVPVISGNSAMPTQCSSVPSQLLYADRKQELVAPSLITTNSSALANRFAGSSPVTLSFLYRKAAVFGDDGAISVLAVPSFQGSTRFIVNEKGQPVVIRENGFVSNATLAVNVNLKDGLWHFVVWQVSFASGTFSYTLYIDGITYGTASVTLPSYVSRSPFVQRLSDQVPASVDAEVRDVFVFDNINTFDIQYLRLCMMARVPSRCSAPSGDRFLLARQNVTQSNGPVCNAAGQLLRSELAFDLVHPPVFSLSTALAAQWSITFWLRGGDRSLTGNAARLLDLTANTGSVQVNYVTGSTISLVVNGVSTTLGIYDGISHSVALVTGTNNQVLVYVDTLLVATLSNVNAVQPASTNTFAAGTTAIQMVKVYDVALTAVEVETESTCLLQDGLLPTQFLPPTGYCSIASDNSAGVFGYCRQSAQCVGHCTAYSVIDVNTGTYTPLANECDDGWAAPSCVNKCARVDPITNQCLDLVSSQAVGLIPGSELCQLLLNYKLSVNPVAKTLRLTPRRWQYTVSVGAPAGVVTNVIDTGSCPQTNIIGTIDGSLQVIMQNTGSVPSVVNVIYAPDAVLNEGAPCEAPCCSTSLDAPITIPANSAFTLSVPSAGCGNTSVIVQLAANVFDPFTNITSGAATQCSQFNGQQVNQLVNTAFNQAVPSNVQSSISVSLNTAAAAIQDIGDKLGTQLTNLFQLGYTVGFNSDSFANIIAAQQSVFANTTYNPLQLGAVNPFNLDNALDSLNNDTRAANAALAESGKRFDEANIQLAILAQRANESAILSRFYLDLAFAGINQTFLQLQQVRDLPGGVTTIGEFFKGVGEAATGVVRETLGIAESAIGKGLNGLLGSTGIGGFFSSILQTALNVAIVGGAVYVGYLVFFKGGPAALSSVRAARKARSNSYTPLTNVVAAKPVGSRVLQHRSTMGRIMRHTSEYDDAF